MKNWLCKPTSLEEAKEIIERAVANGAENRNDYAGDCYESSFYGVYNGSVTYTIKPIVYYDDAEILTIDQVRKQFPLPNEKSVELKFCKDIGWLWNAQKLGATHYTIEGDMYKVDFFSVQFYDYEDDNWCGSIWDHPVIIAEHGFYPIDYSPLESKTEGGVCSKTEPTTWDGKGFPSVGVKCFKDNRPVIITYVGKDVICFEYLDTKMEHSAHKVHVLFTTEKSERELWIEGAIKAMKEVHLKWDNKDPASEQKCRLYAESIYDKMIKQK